MAGKADRRAGRAALAALASILVITAAWWALALWPPGTGLPASVARVRAVCFGAVPGGLPDAAGWAALVGQPLVMLAILLAGWGREVRAGLRSMSGRTLGRALLASVTALLVAGAASALLRIREAAAVPTGTLEQPATALEPAGAGGESDPAGGVPGPAGREAGPGTPPRLDRPAPALRLIDQRGGAATLEAFRGRPVFVTFAYAHCETVCPAVVRDVLDARRRLAEEGIPAAALVVTLDPWRDTPARLSHIAGTWGLEEGERVLSGGVEEVGRALDAWRVPRSRDTSNGAIVHPRLTYLVDAEGRIAYASAGGVGELVALTRRLQAHGP